MVTINFKGRLGNNIIQYIVGYMISIKFKLKLKSPQPFNFGDIFFHTIDFTVENKNLFIVNDKNWIEVLLGDNIDGNYHFHLDGFFQDKIFYESHFNEIRKYIDVDYDYSINNNSLFIHYRIGDIMNDRRMLPIEYYLEAINMVDFDKGYISSDNLEHEFCERLISEFNLTPISLNPEKTISFGKNFNKLILSEGTFSWVIAFFSEAEKIICNERKNLWFGDIFFDSWTKLHWDYQYSIIYDKIKLKEYKPIKLKC